MLKMLVRLRSGRRLHTYLKIGTCVFVGICYFVFLFRESINAFENRERANRLEVADYAEPTKQQLKRQQIQRHNSYIQHQNPRHYRNRNKPGLANGSLAVGSKTNVITSSTLNPVYEYSEELHSCTDRELRQRRERLNTVCEKYKLQEKYPPNPWEFFISPGHNNLVWCNVFKAASSTWLYYFNILAGYDLKYLERTEVQPIELARQRFPRPELPELMELIPSALSFLFVRDPFERILSAYRNKLEGNRNSFYKGLGNKIMHRFRRRSFGGPWPRCGPTFEEFVHFLIQENEEGHLASFDEHWAPIYRFCTPCSVNFTIIGKTETFQRDSEFIIRQAGLESLLLGKLPRRKMRKIRNQAQSGIKSEALVERYFADLNRSTLDQLLKIYRIDFELFDYDYFKYYDMVQGTPHWSQYKSTPIPKAITGPVATLSLSPSSLANSAPIPRAP